MAMTGADVCARVYDLLSAVVREDDPVWWRNKQVVFQATLHRVPEDGTFHVVMRLAEATQDE